jgi:hypothetical protein
MNIVPDMIRALFTEGSSDTEAARKRLAATELAHRDAVAALEVARTQHSEQAVELMARTDGGKALVASRRAVEQASDNVDDLASAVTTLRDALAKSEQADRTRSEAHAWEQAESLLARRTAGASDLQDKADAFLDSLRVFLQLNEQAYSALPKRPDFRPLPATWAGACNLVELYLYGNSEGVICSQGVSPHVAKSRPDLVSTARELTAQLLKTKPQRQGAMR